MGERSCRPLGSPGWWRAAVARTAHPTDPCDQLRPGNAWRMWSAPWVVDARQDLLCCVPQGVLGLIVERVEDEAPDEINVARECPSHDP